MRLVAALVALLACSRLHAAESETAVPESAAAQLLNSPPQSAAGWWAQTWSQVDHSSDCFYGSKELLLWWMKGTSLRPLATVGDTAAAGVPGSLAQPGTAVVLGNQIAGAGLNDGARFALGYWLDPAHTLALEANFLFLAQRTSSGQVSSAGLSAAEVLARPYVDQFTGQPDAQRIAGPGLTGAIGDQLVRRLLGGEANVRVAGGQWGAFRLDFLGGFRFLAFDDDLNISSLSTGLTAPGVLSSAAVLDSFAARNRFYGGQLGAVAQYALGRWNLQATGKVALGGTAQEVDINGFTTTSLTGTTAAGFLAQPTNIGRHTRSEFAVFPEIGLSLGYQVTHWLRLFAGYTFLYDSNVVRSANHVDLVSHAPAVPGVLAPGQSHPAFAFQGTDFWVQGISVGVELRH